MSTVNVGFTVLIFACLSSFDFRSVIGKPFYRYNDVQAGQVVEVGTENHLLLETWLTCNF